MNISFKPVVAAAKAVSENKVLCENVCKIGMVISATGFFGSSLSYIVVKTSR